MTTWTSVGLLALLAPVTAAAPQDRTVSVRVLFSVDEYDASKPSKAVMKCVVRNNSPLAVNVPVGFDGGYVQVQSGQLTLRKTKKAKDDVKLAWVEPGHEEVVFELPLDDIFLRSGGQDGVWHWDWPRRPEPPRSPVHKYRMPGFVDQASFTVSLDLGGSTLKSEAATLKVKQDGDK